MPIFSVCIVFKGAFFPYVDDNLAPNWLWLIFYDAVKNDTTWRRGGGQWRRMAKVPEKSKIRHKKLRHFSPFKDKYQ